MGEQAPRRLRDHRWGQGMAQIFLAGWPAGHVLGVAPRVMPDVRDLGRVHGKQGEFAGDGTAPAKVSVAMGREGREPSCKCTHIPVCKS
jgi:hypothetical protein